MLKAILNERNMSLYKLEKSSLVSHATLNDIYNEKININNCTISVMSKLANALNLEIEDLYRMLTYDDISLFAYNEDFDLFIRAVSVGCVFINWTVDITRQNENVRKEVN